MATNTTKPAYDVDSDFLPASVTLAAIGAYVEITRSGSVWLGEYSRENEKYMRFPQDLAFEYDETAVTKILEDATVKILNGALLEGAEEMEKIKDILMKALKQYFLNQYEEGESA